MPGLFPMPKTLFNRKQKAGKSKGQKSAESGQESCPTSTEGNHLDGDGGGSQPLPPMEEPKVLTPMDRGRQRMLNTLREELASGRPPFARLLPPVPPPELPPEPEEPEVIRPLPKKLKGKAMADGGLSSGAPSASSSAVSSPRQVPSSTSSHQSRKEDRPFPFPVMGPAIPPPPRGAAASASAPSSSYHGRAALIEPPPGVAPEAHESALCLLGLTAGPTFLKREHAPAPIPDPPRHPSRGPPPAQRSDHEPPWSSSHL